MGLWHLPKAHFVYRRLRWYCVGKSSVKILFMATTLKGDALKRLGKRLPNGRFVIVTVT